MISTARIYILNIKYAGRIWLSISDCDKLSGQLAQLIKNGIPLLKFKNLQIFNIYKNEMCSNEIHINKIMYDGRRTLIKDDVSAIRDNLRKQLSKISNFEFEQILVINDEFSERITPAYLSDLNLGV